MVNRSGLVLDKVTPGSVDRQINGDDFKSASSRGGWADANSSITKTRVECTKESICLSFLCIHLFV